MFSDKEPIVRATTLSPDQTADVDDDDDYDSDEHCNDDDNNPLFSSATLLCRSYGPKPTVLTKRAYIL